MEEKGVTQNSKLRLLFVEDNPADAELALKQLQKGGFEVTADIVQTADDLRSKLAGGHYDIVLSDLGLPNWSGLDALEILKQTSLDIPFIMVTGTVGEETVAECLKLGATDYVLKDRPSRLPAAIRRALQEKGLREERSHAQEQILKLAAIVDSSNDAIIGKTVDGVITSWNKGAEKLYGYSSAEVLGQPISILALPDRSEELSQILASLARGTLIEQFESVRVRKDGSLVDVSLSMFPLTDSRGEVTGVASIARDITERKRAEERLQEYEKVVEGLDEMILVVDREYRYVIANRAYLSYRGLTREQLVEHAVPDFLDENLFAGVVRKRMDECFQGKAVKYELKIKFPEIGERDLFVSYFPIEGPAGIDRIVCVLQDITARKEAEKHLAQMEGRYRGLLEAAPDAMVVVNKAGEIVLLNLQAEKQFGYHRDELVGKNVKNIIPEGFAERLIADALRSAEDALGQQIGTGITLTGRRKNGSDFPIEIMLSPLENAEGTMVTAAIRDITARKEAEKHLAQTESRYRGLLEAAPDAMVVVNHTGEIVLLNLQAEKQFGYHRDELVGKDVKNIIPEGFAERLVADGLRSAEDALAQQIGMGIEITGRRKDGSDFPIEIMLSPLESAEGILVTAAIRDISVRKRAEAERTRLMTAIEQAAEGLVVTDADGKIQYVNPAFSAMTGYSREEALGKNPRILKSGKHDAAFYANMWATILAGEVWRGEMINRRKDGSLYTEKMSITPVHNEHGKMTHIVAMKEDITARKLLEDQFRQAQKMEAMGRLAAGVAHDFNNLLTIIVGYSEVMLDQFAADDPMRAYTTEIKGAGERAAGLTRQLLAFSRQQVLAPQLLDLNTLIANLAKLLKRLIGEDIDLVFNAGTSPATVKADPGHIEQVLMNLAVNSRDAMPGGGKLTIETSHIQVDESFSTAHFPLGVGPHVMLAVSDTGCGMDKATQAHIFEPFFTTKEQGKGTGLGLATVYGIVKQSEGHIWVYSEPGAGTTFKIYLPAAKGAIQAAPENAIPAGGSETVLLVEDDAGLRELARMVLVARGGYKVLESIGGKEARLFAEQYKGTIHLLLTDVVMPGMGGRQLSEQLATLRPEMKILYMSGYTDDTVLRHGVLEEGMAYLQKPFTAESLLRKVRDVLDMSQPFG